MTNYDNSVIYKICCKDEAITDVYVGSTANARNRKHKHKSACNNKDNNSAVYRYIRDYGGWENWQFVLLEKFPCKDRQELIIRERYWYEKLRAKLNVYYPQRSRKERNKEYRSRPEVKERRKEYLSRPEVKEQVKEQKKEYYSRPEVKERVKEYLSRPEVKERVKEYLSRPEVKDRQKQISERNKQTYTCLPCNKILKIGSKKYHEKTNKHLQNLEKQQEEEIYSL